MPLSAFLPCLSWPLLDHNGKVSKLELTLRNLPFLEKGLFEAPWNALRITSRLGTDPVWSGEGNGTVTGHDKNPESAVL